MMVSGNILILLLVSLAAQRYQVESYLLRGFPYSPENIADPESINEGLEQDGFLPFQNEYLEEDTGYDSQAQDDGESYSTNRLGREGERTARQKSCKWTGCHKLPLGKESSCPNGTYLESFKVCDPRGSKNVDVQCCP